MKLWKKYQCKKVVKAKNITIKRMEIKIDRKKTRGWNCKENLKNDPKQKNNNQNDEDRIWKIKKLEGDKIEKHL
jgi:hypothetical protein